MLAFECFGSSGFFERNSWTVGGFGSYLLGLNRKTYEQAGIDTEGNSPTSIKDPGFGWMTGVLFLVCFVGLFVLIPLRKVYTFSSLLFSFCNDSLPT